MRIFISYGHDCAEFVIKLRFYLEKKGHDVWMDLSRIQSGSDWRNEIAEGIIRSQACLIFLSSHSLREGSVCIDEMTIAVACNRRIIRPILMEKGIENSIPSMISEKQFYDFSDWRSCFKDEGWFQKIIMPLEEELALMESDPYEAQMDMLRTTLRPYITKTRLLRELEKPYCPRDWLDNRINTWIKEVGTSHLLMIGLPGSGKSSYFTHYSQFSPCVVSLILCEWNQLQKNDAHQAIRNISYQIASRISSFRNRLIWLLNTRTISIHALSATELFDLLIIEPFLYEINGDRETFLIVLDGLDELSHDGENELSRLIAEKLSILPNYVRFMIASRKDTTVLRHYSGAYIIELVPTDKNVREDIRHYIFEQLKDFSQKYSDPLPIARIEEVCEGSFLFAYLITTGIQQGMIDPVDTKIPSNIYSIYFGWMSRLVSEEEYMEKYYGAFSILASLNRPLSLLLFREALNWKMIDLNGFIRRFRSFLIEEIDICGEKCISLYHHSFRNWLTDENGVADIFAVAMEDGCELLAKGALALWKRNKLPDNEVPNLRAYLTLAEMTDALDELLYDDSYLRALISIARASSENPIRYSLADRILRQCEDICKKTTCTDYAKYVACVEIPLLRATALFDSGDFHYVIQLLMPAFKDITSLGYPEDTMQCLFLLGTSCDLMGERKESLHYFEILLKISIKEQDKTYYNRALIGLAWNGHFNDIVEMNRIIHDLEKSLSCEREREKTLIMLVMARSMLSCGNISEALSLFSDALNNADTYIWGYNHFAVRNQMLLCEALVACYDNEEFELGISYGHQIFAHLIDTGSIAECYCGSWLAANYLANGMLKDADYYLSLAENINNTSNCSSTSGWMNMHLTSLRAFLLAENGDYQMAYQYHQQVIEMAEECNDLWVLGDALFELIYLYLYEGIGDQKVTLVLSNNLTETAEKSGLPHLIFKSSLMAAALQSVTPITDIKKIAATILENSLAATDMIKCGDICRQIAKKNYVEDVANDMAGFIRKEVNHIMDKNPHGTFRKRRTVVRIFQNLYS